MAMIAGTVLTRAEASATDPGPGTWTALPAGSTTAWAPAALGATSAATTDLLMVGTGSCRRWTGDMTAPLLTEVVGMRTTEWAAETLVAILAVTLVGIPEEIPEASETGQNPLLLCAKL